MEFTEEYPLWMIQAVLEHWDEINEMKYVRASRLDSTVSSVDSSGKWQYEEGHTMQQKHPKLNKGKHNSYQLIETLCCITADIEQARHKALTPEEDFALIARFNLLNFDFTPEAIQMGDEAIFKLLKYLNREILYV